MIWNTAPFSQAHASLVSAAADLNVQSVEAILQPVKNDLHQLLASPAKSESSRDQLSKKVVKIDDEEIELNDAFLNDAARIADELNLDELVAAHLAYYAIGDAKRLGVSIFESALTLYYVRRQYIIDIVRFCLESLPLDKFDIILGSPENRLNRILDALKAVERSMEDLDDKAKTGEFMGLSKNPEFAQVLKMQREFLTKEHECLGNVLYAYFYVAAESENRTDTLMGLLKHLSSFEVLDSRILSYFPPLVLWFSAPHNETFTSSLWSYFTSPSLQGWKLPFWQAGLALVVHTTLADEERALPPQIDFSAIKDAVRHAVDSSGIEFWLSFVQDVNASLGDTYFEKFRPLVRSRVPQFSFWQLVPSQTTLDNLQHAWEILITGFVANLADILREMRLSEEDMYLAMNELEGDAHSVSPGLDLERFLLFVAIVLRDRPESSKLFFEDEGDALYGFLLWAADFQVTFMSTTFAELVASLANNETTSQAVHEFLVKGAKQSTQSEDGLILSWSSIYDVIEYYIRGMTAPQYNSVNNGNTSSAQVAADFAVPGLVSIPGPHPQGQISVPTIPQNGITPSLSSGPTPASLVQGESSPATYNSVNGHASAPATQGVGLATPSIQWGMPEATAIAPVAYAPPQQPSQLSDDTLLILSAYMTLISRASYWCEDARKYIRGTSVHEEAYKNRDIVPLLFKLLKLQQPITGAILDALIPFASPEMWPLLDNFVLGKFEENLSSLQDALALVKLVERLSDFDPLSPRLNDYIEFICKTVLPWTTAKKEYTLHLRNVCTLLQLSCMGFIKALLQKSPHSQDAFRVCFSANVYQAIFEVLTIGIDNINELETDLPLVQTVTRSVEVVYLLVKLSVPPSWSFDKPILYHLEVVPHLALYASSLHRQLSLSSINLLTLLDQSPEFRPTIDRQSRILSILSSTTESTRIRVGFMSRLEDSSTNISVKILLLEMIIRQLRQSGTPRHYMTVAHYLLGFSQSELGLELKLELESGVGGVLSGSSLLTAVCDTLLRSLLDVKSKDFRLLRLCSEVLWHLVKDPLTSEMVLDYLRQFDFWLNTIKCEAESLDCTDLTDEFLEHRAAMLEIWISEVQLCQKRLLLTIETHYLEALVPIVFSLVSFTAEFPQNRVAFKCLKAWCKLIPVLIASGDPSTGSTFVSRIIQLLIAKLPEYSRQNAEFAVPVASLLVFLFEKFQERGADDSVARHMRNLFDAALLSIQPAQVNSELRSFLYSLCFQNLKLVLQTGSKQTQAETLQALTCCGPRLFHIACDDVLGYSNEPLKLGALLFIQMSAILAGKMGSGFISNILLQYNFVSIFINQILDPALASASNTSKSAATGINNDVLSTTTGSGSLANTNSIKSSNSLVLKSNHGSSDNSSTLTGSSREDDEAKKSQIAKISLSLLLPIAQTRPGAANILTSDLLRCLDTELSNLQDELLSLVLQLLIAIIVSLGSENTVVLEDMRHLLERHKSSVEVVLRRDAAINFALQDQSSESEVSHLARNFTILLSLTGATSN